MSKYYYKPGDWNCQCDVCGRRFRASEMKQRWDGVMVCSDDFETRHPQDMIRPRTENTQMPFTRPVNWQARTDGASWVDTGYPTITGTFNGNTL